VIARNTAFAYKGKPTAGADVKPSLRIAAVDIGVKLSFVVADPRG
jgi:TolB-like protein